MALFAQEEDRWLLTLAGYGEHAPPGDEEGFEAFLESVAPADLLAILRAGEPLDELVTHSFPANRRRHYERMHRFPAGLLVVGDAVCSFNPIYGQGMTVAAAEAEALRDNLRRGARRLRRRHFRATARIVNHAWQLAIGADLALPEVKGARPLSVRLGNAYSRRLQQAAQSNGIVVAAFGRVTGMLDRPTHLMRPAVLRRVLRGARADALPWPGRPPRTPVRRRTLRVEGIVTPLREAGRADSEEAVVFVHGVPGSGADFEPLLAAAGQVGRAVAWDAPGFGKADKPASFDQSTEGHAAFLGHALDELGVERAHLVLHDFGGPWGLAWAMSAPERLATATLICTGVPIAYRWHRTARVWRTPLIGEASMATLTRPGFRAGLRRSGPRRLPGPLVDRMYEDLDRETQKAILRLYRSVGDLDQIGRETIAVLRPLERPALVIWGEGDPYVPAEQAHRQRQVFADAEVHVLKDSGHWPFVNRADRVEELLLPFLERSLDRELVSTPRTDAQPEPA